MTFKHILRTSTALLGAALMALPSTMALAQGGNNPIEGIDIIIKEDPSQAKISPFSLSDKEIAQINSIKGPERLALVLQAVTKRVKTDEGFVKSGMAVMGKDWCGECEWPEQITYKFRNGRTTYKLGMTLSEGANKSIGQELLNVPMGRMLRQKSNGETPDVEKVETKNIPLKWSSENGANQFPSAAEGRISKMETAAKTSQIIPLSGPVNCATEGGAVDANCDGVADPQTGAVGAAGNMRNLIDPAFGRR